MPTVRLTLTPAWNGDTVGSLAVRLTFDLPVRRGQPLFRIRSRSIDKPFAALDGEIALSDRNGRRIPCETVDCDEDMGTVRVFLPQSDALPSPEPAAETGSAAEAALSYTVLPAPAGRNPVLDLGSEPGGLTGSGMTFLPAFFAEGDIRYLLRWDLSAMPKSASAASSFGEGDAARTGDGNTLISAFYAVGAPLDCVRVGAFRYYWIRNPKLLETAVDAARIFAAESAFFRDDGAVYSIFTRHAADCLHPGGTADSRAYLWLYRDNDQIDRAALNFLFAHEMVHNWITAPDEPYGTCTWFVEGAAEFYSLVLPWRAGIASPADLCAELNRRAADYYENPARTASNRECGQAFLDDPEKTKVPYGRGLFYLLHADAAIRRSTGGAESLDDLIETLRQEITRISAEEKEIPAASRRVNEAWIREYGRYVGEDAARQEFAELERGKVWPPEPAAFGQTIRAEPHPSKARATAEDCTGWKFDGE